MQTRRRKRRLLMVVALTGAIATMGAPAGALTAPSSEITSPRHGGFYSYLGSIDATAVAPSTVHMSLKMKLANGNCKAFNGTRFVARACNNPRWLPAASEGSGWSLELPEGFLLRPSDANSTVRHYVASTRASLDEALETGRNVSRFEIYGGP